MSIHIGIAYLKVGWYLQRALRYTINIQARVQQLGRQDMVVVVVVGREHSCQEWYMCKCIYVTQKKFDNQGSKQIMYVRIMDHIDHGCTPPPARACPSLSSSQRICLLWFPR